MEPKDLIDLQIKSEPTKFDHRKKYAFSIFFLLDLVCFVRGADQLKALLIYGFEFDFALLAYLVLLLSLLASAVLFFIRKKSALIIYYFQFPLRIIFLGLSFGFLIDLFGMIPTVDWYNGFLIIILLLEFLRLYATVLLHRQYN